MNKFSDIEQKILSSGIQLNYLADEFLFRQGQKNEYVFYLEKGALLLTWIHAVKPMLIIDQPTFVGIEEVLMCGKYSCSAMTSIDSTFLVFERPYFLELMNEFDDGAAYFKIITTKVLNSI